MAYRRALCRCRFLTAPLRVLFSIPHTPRLCDGPPMSSELEQPDDMPLDGRSERARRQRSQTRERILTAATRVFAREGYSAASIAQILKAARVARGTFYLHFESKEAALGAALEDFMERLAGGLRPVTTRTPEAARDELIANLTRALALLDASPEFAGLIFRNAAALPPEVGTHLERFFDVARALIVRALNAGVRLGLVKDGDQSLRAQLILGALAEVAPPPLPPAPARDAAARHHLALAMLDFALSGVLRDPRLVAPLFAAAPIPEAKPR